MTLGVSAIVQVRGKLAADDNPEYARRSRGTLERSLRSVSSDDCMVLPAHTGAVLDRHLRHAFSMTSPQCPTCVHYVGDVVVADNALSLALAGGERVALSQLLRTCAADASDVPLALVVLDTACYRIQSMKKSLRPEALADATQPGCPPALFLFPIGTSSGTTLVHDDDDDDDTGSDGESRPTFCSVLAAAFSTLARPGFTGDAAELAARLSAIVDNRLQEHGVPARLGSFATTSQNRAWTISFAPSNTAGDEATKRMQPIATAAPGGPTREPSPLASQPASRPTPQPAPQAASDASAVPHARGSTVASPAPVGAADVRERHWAEPPFLTQSLNAQARPFEPPVFAPSSVPHQPGLPPSSAPSVYSDATSSTMYPSTIPAPMYAGVPVNVPAPMPPPGGLSRAGKGVFYCPVCNCDVFGDQNWQLHLISEKHRRKEVLANPLLSGRVLDPTTAALLVNPNNFFKCDVCNVVISGQANIHQHLNGQQHKRNAATRGGHGTAGAAPPAYASSQAEQGPSSSDPVVVPGGRRFAEDAPTAMTCQLCETSFTTEAEFLAHHETREHLTRAALAAAGMWS